MSGAKRKNLDTMLADADIKAPSEHPVATVPVKRPRRYGREPPKTIKQIETMLRGRITFANVAPDMSLIADIKMSDPEREFVRWYLILGKGVEAQKAAYPNTSKTYKNSHASQILKRPRIQAALERMRSARAQEIVTTMDGIRQELWELNQANVYDYVTETDDGKLIMKRMDNLTELQKRNLKTLVVKSIRRKDETGEVIEEQQVRFEVYNRAETVMNKAKLEGLLKDRTVLDLGDTLVQLLRDRAGRHGRTIDAQTGDVES